MTTWCNMSDEITISVEEYNKLLKDSQTLEKLISAGVEGWAGYEFALEDDD